MPKTKLGRYRGQVGVFVIREKDQVLYVGWARDIYDCCCRYFNKDGPLEEYEIKQASFELLLCSLYRAKKVTQILRNHLQPSKNTLYLPPKLNRNERQQKQRLLTYYRQHSFFESSTGDHKSDEEKAKE
ncbi:hypothetical protein [Aureispira anguillae]|nr:hypothetical protein [Aureispira anguillae]